MSLFYVYLAGLSTALEVPLAGGTVPKDQGDREAVAAWRTMELVLSKADKLLSIKVEI